MVTTIVVIGVIVVVGVSVLAYRYRSEKGIESGISSFRRELRALAPESGDPPRAHRRTGDPPRTSGVGILRPDADDEGADEEGADDEEAGVEPGDAAGEDTGGSDTRAEEG